MKPFDANGTFQANPEGIFRPAIRGAGATMLSSGLGLFIQIAASAILARILTPGDFGLVTMVTTFSLLLMNFGLNGFTEAVIQREQISHPLASNLFWINLVAGLVLTLGFSASGSLLARFYGDPRVAHVAVGISIAIFFTSTSVLHLALLKRAMQFPFVSANDICSRAIALAVAVALARAGWGYWALVWGVVGQSLAQTVGAWTLCRWTPGLPRRVPGTAQMFRYAMNVYGSFGINYFTRNVDNVLVGEFFSAQALGFYKKAYDLFALSASQSVSPLANVAISALSRIDRNSIEFKQTLSRLLEVIAFLGMGLGALLTLVGKDLIRLLLGPGWETAGRIFTVFGPGIGMMLLYYTNGWIHLSIGRSDRWLRWGLAEFGVTFSLFLFVLRWGPMGMAAAWTASFWLLLGPAFWYAGRPIGLGLRPLLEAVWKHVVSSILAGLIAAVTIIGYAPFAGVHGVVGAACRLVTTTLWFTVLYLGAVVLLHRGCSPIYQLAGLVREMLPWRGRSRPTPVDETDTCVMATNTTGVDRKPLVSILIPAFNAQEWIADTIRSAIAQTWPNKEIIVVDDGSTDQTLAIAREFEPKGVRVVTQKNQGAAAARNKAFALSHGEYIQWLDADDLLAPDKISRQMSALNGSSTNRIILSSSFGLFKYRYYRAEFLPTALWCDLSPVEWLVRKLAQNAYMQTATWLVSRGVTEEAGPWDTRLLSDDDGEYFCRVLLMSDGVRFVPEAKVYYRAPWPNSLSNIGRSRNKIEAHWVSMQLHVRHLRLLEDSERVRAACLTYLQTCLIYFYPERLDIVRQMEALAAEMGGHLESPCLPLKYSWIQRMFGWNLAKRVQVLLPRLKWYFIKSWDKALFRFETRNQRQDEGPWIAARSF